MSSLNLQLDVLIESFREHQNGIPFCIVYYKDDECQVKVGSNQSSLGLLGQESVWVAPLCSSLST